jgi:hypothetical protein
MEESSNLLKNLRIEREQSEERYRMLEARLDAMTKVIKP